MYFTIKLMLVVLNKNKIVKIFALHWKRTYALRRSDFIWRVIINWLQNNTFGIAEKNAYWSTNDRPFLQAKFFLSFLLGHNFIKHNIPPFSEACIRTSLKSNDTNIVIKNWRQYFSTIKNVFFDDCLITSLI